MDQLVAPFWNPLERVLYHKWDQSDMDLARTDPGVDLELELVHGRLCAWQS